MEYQTEEQQLEAIRTFFKTHQRFLYALLMSLMLAFLGYRYWQWHVTKMKTEASQLYTALMAAVAYDEPQKREAYAEKLMETYPRTIYGQAAGFLLAKYAVDASKFEKAKVALDTVMRYAHLPAIKQIAAIRLARIFIEEKKYTTALDVLTSATDHHYDLVTYELKGDIYLAQHQVLKAKKAYQAAQAVNQQQGMLNRRLEMKLRAMVN